MLPRTRPARGSNIRSINASRQVTALRHAGREVTSASCTPTPQRVAAALRAGGADGRSASSTTRPAPPPDAAAALDVPVGAIVKSLVFTADGAPVLVLASGDHQVDTSAVATLGVERVERADPETVRDATGFPIGGVAPVGHPAALRTVVDSHLADFDVVWAAAGTPHAVFATTYDELCRLTGGSPAARRLRPDDRGPSGRRRRVSATSPRSRRRSTAPP